MCSFRRKIIELNLSEQDLYTRSCFIFTVIHNRNWSWSISFSTSFLPPTLSFSTTENTNLPFVLWIIILSNFSLYAWVFLFVYFFFTSSSLNYIQTQILTAHSDPSVYFVFSWSNKMKRTKKTIPVFSVNIHCWMKSVVRENKRRVCNFVPIQICEQNIYK